MIMSRTVDLKTDGTSTLVPAAAVPVNVKMPDPMTEPIPSATRLHRPRWRRRRKVSSSLDKISASMLLVRKSGDMPKTGSPLALALHHLLHLALARAPGHVGGAAGLGRRLPAGSALQLLAFLFIGDGFRVHSILIPAYFATNFFNPYPGKLTVTLASPPEPSRRRTVPRPYLACSTVEPGPTFLGGLLSNGAAGLRTGGVAGVPFSAKNCRMFSTEL